MQPFPMDNNHLAINSQKFFFRKNQTFDVKIYVDPKPAVTNGPGLLDDMVKLVGRGQVALEGNIYVDVDVLNKDPFEPEDLDVPWDQELDKITSGLHGLR